MADAVMETPDCLPIDDVEVGISLTHANEGDLNILLQSPDKNKNIEKESGERLWVLT
jgi:subtilisin-like proprotein convertase family protein